MEHWVALDLETSGLSPTRHEIRELAAVTFGIEAVHQECDLRFQPADIRKSPRHAVRTKLGGVLEMFARPGSVLVAHNAAFDVAFLSEALRRTDIGPFSFRAYCTLRLARRILPDLPRHDLASLRQELHISTGKPHTAIADARAVAALFTDLTQKANLTSEKALCALHGPPISVNYRSAPKRNVR